MAKLIVRYPNNNIKEVEFEQPKYKIGTASDNDLVLENEEVAPHHAEIDTADGAFSIVDLSESKNTAVNGKKFDRVNLNYGDRIAFGPVIGLFYPSKKGGGGGGGEKMKLFLYFGAGGAVLILSIVLMVYFTSRRLSNVVSREIGGLAPAEVRTREKPKRERTPRSRVAGERTPAREVGAEEGGGETPIEGEEAPRPRRRGEPTLPEVSPEAIKSRTAKAIPRGARGLFFRKEPVIVYEAQAVPAPLSESALPREGAPPGEAEAAAIETAPGEGEAGLLPEAGEVLSAEGEETGALKAAEEKGLIAKAFSPVTRLFKGRKEEEAAAGEALGGEELTAVPPPAGQSPAGEEAGPEAGGASPAGAETPAALIPVEGKNEEVARILDPLAGLRKLDIPELRDRGFKEKPVYSDRELLEYRGKEIFKDVPLSEAADVNTSDLWEYPQSDETRGPIIRTCAVGYVDGDRVRDVVFGTKEGVLFLLNGKDGLELATRDFGEPFFEPILADLDGDRGEEIVLAFESGRVVVLGANLEQRWVYEGKDRITSLPAVTDLTGDRVGDVVFTTLGMDLVAIDGKTGFEIWRFFDAESEILNSPVAVAVNDDGVKDIVFVSTNGFLYAVDGKTGWGLWKGNISGRPAGNLAVGPLAGGMGAVIVTLTRNGSLAGFETGGKQLFTYQLNGAYVTGPTIGDMDGDGKAEIATIDVNGGLKVVEGVTRREKWSFQSEAGSTVGRLAAADVNYDGKTDVVFTTFSGVLTVLDGRSGSLIASRNFKDYSFATPVVADVNGDGKQELLSLMREGKVRSTQITDARKTFFALKKSGWYSLNGDIRNTAYSQLLYFWERR
jgi:outer membrane protein assembly factor BamB